MKKSRHYTVLFLCSIQLLWACNTQTDVTPVSEPSVDSSPITTAEILPGSKGPRLEATTIDGEFVIPAGAEATIPTDADTLVASIQHLLIPPAYAAGISKEVLAKFDATIDGDPVDMEIVETRIDKEGNQIVSYRLLNVPESDTVLEIEFTAPDGPFSVGGLIEKVEEKKANKAERFTIETQALLDYAKQYETEKEVSLKTLTYKKIKENFEKIKKQQEFVDFKNKIQEELKNPGNRKKPPGFYLEDPRFCAAIRAGSNIFQLKQAARALPTPPPDHLKPRLADLSPQERQKLLARVARIRKERDAIRRGLACFNPSSAAKQINDSRPILRPRVQFGPKSTPIKWVTRAQEQ